MDRKLQRTLMLKVLSHIEAGTTDMAESVYRQPAANYADAARAAQEQALLFRRGPLMMALSCRVPNPGDYITDDMAGIPILIVRGEDGVVRGFRNACSHRGTRVCEGTGHARALTCPYHGWTYALDGRLRGIPDKRSFPGVDPAEHGLQPLPTVERHGMVWMHPTPAPDGATTFDVAPYLGNLDTELASYGLAAYHHYDQRIVERPMNWKLVMDTFLEPYHLGVLHRDTVAPLFVHNLCLFEPFGVHLRELLPRTSIAAQGVRPDQELDAIKHNSIIYVLFPNTVIVVQVDHIETWRVFPVDGRPDKCVMQLDFVVSEPIESDSAKRHWERNLDLTIRTVLNEDFVTALGMHRNYALGSPAQAVFGRNEPALAHFERTVNEQVAARAASTAAP
jgi:nitrite reductase/ring-hydroxylating ferredoxin subunit